MAAARVSEAARFDARELTRGADISLTPHLGRTTNYRRYLLHPLPFRAHHAAMSR
jgi:hypothetical protein